MSSNHLHCALFLHTLWNVNLGGKESKKKEKHCDTLRHTATHCNTLHKCNTLQHTATHCNTLQHTATHCNTLQHTTTRYKNATHCNTLRHTATQCNTLQHTATHGNTLQHATSMHPCWCIRLSPFVSISELLKIMGCFCRI